MCPRCGPWHLTIPRVTDPVYHYQLCWRPGERPSRAQHYVIFLENFFDELRRKVPLQ